MRSSATGWLLLGAILFNWGCNGGDTFDDPPTMPEQPMGEQVDQPPMDQPPMDQPPMDQPPLDQPTMDQPPMDQSLLDEPSEPLGWDDSPDAPDFPPAAPEELPVDADFADAEEHDGELLEQLSPFEQPGTPPEDVEELPLFPPDQDD